MLYHNKQKSYREKELNKFLISSRFYFNPGLRNISTKERDLKDFDLKNIDSSTKKTKYFVFLDIN